MMKGEDVARLLRERKHEGSMASPSGKGNEDHPLCDDRVSFYIRVEGNKIKEASYEAYHCASAIAGSELTAILAEGKELEEAEKITLQDLESRWGKLGNVNVCCKQVGLLAMKKAITSYRTKAGNEA